jgi:putative transposase
MAKGQRLKPEQIVTLLHQIDVLTTNGKTLAQACKEVGTVELPSLAQDLWWYVPKGIPFGQSRSGKEVQRFRTRKYLA